MANPEDEIRDLREKNSELAQEVQFWKMTAGQREKEKLDLMKEVNDLRLKLSRLRSGGAAQARKLDAALQSASEEALSHLVQASGAVARTIELAKQYMQDRQELDASSPRWSNLGGTPNNDKVHRVPPLLLGGHSIQPVVSLSRTLVNRSMTRSTNQNSGVTHRALPMHMLQDVYIPLTRIDAADLPAANTAEEERDTSTEDLGLEDSNEQIAEESQNMVSVDDLEESRGLEAVMEEDIEPEDEPQTPPRLSSENPLEGPSWLLDVSSPQRVARNRGNLEPDSTTPGEPPRPAPSASPPPAAADHSSDDPEKENAPLSSQAFTPTVRRRKRTCSPREPREMRQDRRHSNTGRVLKVMVAKMRLSDEDIGAAGDSSPPKRQALVPSPRRSTLEPRAPSPRNKEAEGRAPRFDAPSPNGATDACVIVSEAQDQSRDTHGRFSRRDTSHTSQQGRQDASRSDSRERSDSDSSSVGDGDGRTRRTRKCVSYKEKPLNRKMRR